MTALFVLTAFAIGVVITNYVHSLTVTIDHLDDERDGEWEEWL